jgi:hypothetical protein
MQRECAWAIDQLKRCCEKVGKDSLHCSFPSLGIGKQANESESQDGEAQDVGSGKEAARQPSAADDSAEPQDGDDSSSHPELAERGHSSTAVT